MNYRTSTFKQKNNGERERERFKHDQKHTQPMYYIDTNTKQK